MPDDTAIPFWIALCPIWAVPAGAALTSTSTMGMGHARPLRYMMLTACGVFRLVYAAVVMVFTSSPQSSVHWAGSR